MKHLILANPMSGNKRGIKHAHIIQKLLNKNNINAEILISEHPKYFTKKVKYLVQNEQYRFYSIGGDGTLNEIISGLIGSNSEVVVIPCGTGNDFIKSISQYLSTRKIILSSLNKTSEKVDIIDIGKHGYCINILNLGFDAIVAQNVDKFRNIPLISGKMKYQLAIFYSLMTNKNFKLKIKTDLNTYKGSFTLIAIANGKYYGGGVCPCPNANVSDELLDICTIDKTSVIKKIFLLPKYQKGKHLNLKEVKMEQSKDVRIVSTKKFPVSSDGEIFFTNRLHAKVIHNAINIVKT